MVFQMQRQHWRVAEIVIDGIARVRTGMSQRHMTHVSVTGDDQVPAFLLLACGRREALRSDVGAAFGLEVALRELRHLAQGDEQQNLSQLKRMVEERLPRVIHRAWREAAEQHLARHPWGSWELQSLEHLGSDTQNQVLQSPLLAYDTSLLGAMVTRQFLIFLQIGAGDLLTIDSLGRPQQPLSDGMAEGSASEVMLAAPNAWHAIQVRLYPIVDSEPPALILATTRDFPESFRTLGDYYKAVSEYLHILRTRGSDAFTQRIAQDMAAASRYGRGDDISLGLISRHDPTENYTTVSNTTTTLPPAVRKALADEAAAREALRNELLSAINRRSLSPASQTEHADARGQVLKDLLAAELAHPKTIPLETESSQLAAEPETPAAQAISPQAVSPLSSTSVPYLPTPAKDDDEIW
jgi:hypothetical protein